MCSQACAYIRDNGDTSKGKRRKIVGKDRRKVGKKLSIHSRGLGEGGPLDVSACKSGPVRDWTRVQVLCFSFFFVFRNLLKLVVDVDRVTGGSSTLHLPPPLGKVVLGVSCPFAGLLLSLHAYSPPTC